MSLRTVAPQPKYGLIKKTKSTAPLKKTAFPSGFNNDSDDETSGACGQKDVGRVNSLLTQRSAASEQAANKIYSDALSEDPSAFEYDSVYDSFKAADTKSHALSQANTKEEAPKARYISNLMTTASVRGKERDRIYEKKLIKERKIEDEEYGDKPKFVTSAYKQKLIDDQKWEAEDKLTDEVEAKSDVRSQGMHGFYANLLTKNVAMGGDVKGSALSAYTAGSQRQSQMDSSSSRTDQNASPRASEVDEDKNGAADIQLKRKYDASSVGEDDSNTDNGDAVKSVRFASDQDLGSENAVNDVPSEGLLTEPDIAPIISKSEIISSARQRFLDRKAASLQ